jgi:ferredoxin
MMDATKALLLELDVPKDMIKMEAFGPAPKKPKAGDAPSANAPSEPADAQVTFQASGKTAPLPTEQTVLEAAEGAGVEIDYSCRAGTCGACKVKKLKGEVAMEVDDALDEAEKAEGIVLACQAKSKNDLTIDA